MSKTSSQELPPAVQMYDYSKVREYYRRYGGVVFSIEKTVRTDVLEVYRVLKISAPEKPDKIIFNGQEYRLVPAGLNAGE